MIGLIASLILILISWVKWNNGQRSFVFVTLFFILSRSFGISIFDENPVTPWDLSYLLLFPIVLKEWNSIRKVSAHKYDILVKAIIILEIYYFLSFLVSSLVGLELPLYALKTWRATWVLMFYFFMQIVDTKAIKQSLNVLFGLSFLLGFFYYLQFLGINLLVENFEEADDASGFDRYGNIPFSTIPIIIYFCIAEIKNITRAIFLFFWGGMLVLAQHRGMMICAAISIFLILYLKGEKKKLLSTIIIIGSLAVLLSPILISRFSAKGQSFGEEVRSGLNVDNMNTGYTGSFSVRTFMIVERMDYLMEHPVNLVFGLGSLHESSPLVKKKFDFKLGTHTEEPDGTMSIRQIYTSDVAFLTHILRYGVIGLGLLLFLFKCLYRMYKPPKDAKGNINIYGDLGYAFLTYCILRCLSGDEFYDTTYMFLFLMYILSYRNKYGKIKNLCCSSYLQQA